MPGMAEVDRFLLGNPASQARVREVHPEVCFWALNGRQSMQHSKGKEPGSSERMAVLGACRVSGMAVTALLDEWLAAYTWSISIGRHRGAHAQSLGSRLFL